MVMKLLTKTAEERYQTAAGVEADLRKCLAAWEATDHIDEFPLGDQVSNPIVTESDRAHLAHALGPALRLRAMKDDGDGVVQRQCPACPCCRHFTHAVADDGNRSSVCPSSQSLSFGQHVEWYGMSCSRG